MVENAGMGSGYRVAGTGWRVPGGGYRVPDYVNERFRICLYFFNFIFLINYYESDS